MLANTWVEYSPSGHGLHQFFVVPEGFVFDAEEYYVNNRKVKMENYFPGSTNRFMTVTGNVYRKGTMEVTAEELQLFLDTFMKRPEAQKVIVELPEGGSVLTDAEVMFKAARAENGQKFMDLYLGNWEQYEYPSHSEADLAFCAMLAFFSRGDMSQMDHIYRDSSLYSDKWDARRGESTYGVRTMTRAINSCASFYEKGYRADAAKDFAADETGTLPDPEDESADDETVFRQQAIDALLSGECKLRIPAAGKAPAQEHLCPHLV